ncbi:protein of unknown function [Methylacidimicrobium sp. AP8]|nr:protein of unknown function [Methylacidimicrobium sp. AP8]
MMNFSESSLDLSKPGEGQSTAIRGRSFSPIIIRSFPDCPAGDRNTRSRLTSLLRRPTIDRLSFRRLSSAAERQFCKLRVVGSIPTAGSQSFFDSQKYCPLVIVA